jgi:hypothetical protein
MAPAGCKPTPITWTWVRDLEPLVLEICGSPSYCGPWLARQIAAGLVRWRARSTLPPDEPSTTPSIDFKDCKATELVVTTSATGVTGICRITLLGLEAVREDVEALRPPSDRAAPSPSPPPPSPPSSDPKDLVRPVKPGDTTKSWVFDAVQAWPKPRDMSAAAYITELWKLSGKEWARGTIERRYFE